MRIDQKKRRPIGEKGFTLLEVIVAISILTFGLLAVASMQMTAIRGNYNASNITEATTVAQDRLENLMGLLYSDPLLDPGNYLSDPNPPSPPGYTITYVVLDTPPNPMTNTRLIAVTVKWQDKGVQKQSVLTCVKPQVL
jgi:type IV pilus assembly protein PilV